MRGIVKYLMLLLAGILAASCIFDADQCVIPADQPHSIIFTVSLDRPGTKASWGEAYPSDEGVPFDYRIRQDEMVVAVVTMDGTPLCMVRDLYYWAANDEQTTFRFIGQLPDEFVEHYNEYGDTEPKYKFMVFANCGVEISDDKLTYSYTQLDVTKTDSSIPMWGVTVADMSPLLTSDNLDLGTISLLRAAAKIEVKLSNALKTAGTKITSATLKYYNQTGHCLPSGWESASSTSSLDQENCINVYRHAALNLPLIKDEESGNYYTYVTEYDNINYPEERNKISLEFNIGGQIKYFEDAISFCEYDDGEIVEDSHYNIVRNHIYEFEILSIAGSNLMLEYEVEDWISEDWDGNGKEYEEHDLSYPTYHNPVVPYKYLTMSADDQASYIIPDKPEMYYSNGNEEEGGFHCYFQILAPATVEWKPVFMGSKENYRIRVYRMDKNLVQSTDPIYDTGKANQGNLSPCEAGEWFHIVVFPLSEDGADNTVIEFGISYYQNWTDQYINLYVNGEYGNIRWPGSGDNPKIINIEHISAK